GRGDPATGQVTLYKADLVIGVDARPAGTRARAVRGAFLPLGRPPTLRLLTCALILGDQAASNAVQLPLRRSAYRCHDIDCGILAAANVSGIALIGAPH